MDLKPLTRELHSDERPKLLAHLLALGTEDRRLRFGHALSDGRAMPSSSSTMPILRLLERPTSRATTGMPNWAFPSCR
jgi:hypothetical protein